MRFASSVMAGMKRPEGPTAALPRPVAVVTQRHLLPADGLPARVAVLAAAGVSLVQVREKDLGGRRLFLLVRQVLHVVAGSAGNRCRVVVNGRLDVALAAGAHGVHLPGRGLPAAAVRRLAPPPFLIGVSTHTPAEVEAARCAGADYAFFGPVFPTASHPGAAGTGPDGLGTALEAAAGLPLWAIGGIHEQTVGKLGRPPLAGVAAMRALLLARNPEAAVRALAGASTSPD